MQLRVARLCLNCEEIHASAHCPRCTSESFAYLSRWIPAAERRSAARPPASATQTALPTGSTGGMRWVKRGAAGVAVLAMSRLVWQLTRPVEWSASETIPEDLEDAAGDDASDG
jgi:hypothetical protein